MKLTPFAPLACVLALLSNPASAQDRCLVGSWQPQGNAMLEWMQRRHPGMPMQFRQEGARLVFRADGSYRADMRGEASAGRADGMAARLGGQFGGSGRWSTSADTLVLAQGEDRGDVDLEVKQRGSLMSRIKLPKGNGQPQSFGYRCDGDHFETRMQMPGTDDVVVQPYRRERG